MTTREYLEIPTVHPTGGSYTHACRVGTTVWVAGQVAKNQANEVVGAGDIEAQTRQVFANVASVLEAAGGTLGSIVKFTTFLTDKGDLAGYRAARNEVLATVSPKPPSTLVIVDGLAGPEFLIEIEAIAVLDDRCE